MDLNLERSLNLNQWDHADINWQNVRVEDVPGSNYSLYQVPVFSMNDAPFFSRLFLEDMSGITHGPFPLRIGSMAKGFLGKGFQENGLTPHGPTRFDYILEILDPTQQIEITANAPKDVDFKIQIFELEKGTMICLLYHRIFSELHRIKN